MDRVSSLLSSRYSSTKKSSTTENSSRTSETMTSAVTLPASCNSGISGQSAWSQLDQLLTCAICLDRFRNPKLLPCQHTFCMDPCLEGLIDYIRRQIKCPECRAEHRIPYQGIQGYPTNVTLMRFLELHFEVTGETPDLTPSVKERCGVCSEKAYLSPCGHCDKKVCPDCKEAHVDILRREISRINNQVRRGLHRLQEALGQAEKSVVQLQQNCVSVTQEVEEIFRRLQKALKDREETLKCEVQALLQTELRNLTQLKENLEIEVNNIQSNCELIEKHVNDSTEWEDVELVDYKETFLKTLDFVRNFDPDQVEFNSRLRLQLGTDPEILLQNITHLGDLTINCPQFPAINSQATASQNLMRSKSDHRLATQFHRQEEQQRGSGGNYLGVGQRYGGGHSSDTESRHDGGGGYRRSITERAQHDDGERFGSRRYGREFGGNWQRDDDGSSSSSPYRSRFARDDSLREGSDPEAITGRSVRFARNEQTDAPPPRERLFEIEDAIRGPLSGIARLLDSPIVVRRLQQNEQRAQQKLEEKLNPPPAPQPTNPAPAPVPTPVPTRKTQRQISEEDEIARIKAQNKGQQNQPTVQPAVQAAAAEARPLSRRVSALQKEDEPTDNSTQQSKRHSRSNETTEANKAKSISRQSSTSSSRNTESSHGTPNRQSSHEGDFKTPPSTPTRKLSVDSTKSDATTESEGSVANRRRFFRRQASDGTKMTTNKAPSISESSKSQSSSSSEETDTDKQAGGETPVVTPSVEEDSQDEIVVKPRLKKSADASTSTSSSTSESPIRSAGPKTDTDTGRSSHGQSEVPNKATSTRNSTAKEMPNKSKFVSRFLPRQSTMESTKSSSESDSESDDDKEAKEAARDASISALLARSAIARRESVGSGSGSGVTTSSRSTPLYGNRGNDDVLPSTRKSISSAYVRDKESDALGDRYGSLASRYPLSRRSSSNLVGGDENKDDTGSRYGSYASRYLSRSKSSAALGSERDLSPEVDGIRSGRTTTSSSSSTGADRYRKESRFSAIRRNRLGRSRSSHDISLRDDEDDDDEPATSTYVPTSSYRSPRFDLSPDLARSRSHHALLRDRSPEDGTSSAAISSWAKYLKKKYGGGNRTGSGESSGSMRDSSGHSFSSTRNESKGYDESSDDENRRKGSFNLNTRSADNLRSAYLQKRSVLMKIGTRGSEPGNFTWPRGVAVGPDNSIVVADSSNHRVQVFDCCGRFIKEFGSYGNSESEFDCLAGVAVNRIGQYIISDRYNHRIQIFDPSGRFLRAFGSQGSSDGRLSYPWGIGTDSLGFIYICDKENHRIQVFQSDGTFVGKFGSLGSKQGQLEHPHYIAMSNTNKVFVTDSNNHRVQVFDVNGRTISSFGGEGTNEGEFKFPRGVAVDDQGYVIVGDSGNNRIQIFNSEGVFLRAFGSWGSGDGEFKGLEGVAATSNGNILVCDRENHRIQIF